MINLTLNVDGIEEIAKSFGNFHKENPKAISRAMNKAGAVAETASLRLTRAQWNIRARDLKSYVSRDKATVKNASYVFKFHSTPINLFEFHAKELASGGVSYKIQKKSKKLKSAFIRGKGRNTYVLKRTGKERYPLMPHFSITPSWMFHTEKAEEEYVKVFYQGKGGSRGFAQTYLDQLDILLK